MNVTATCWDKT